MRIGATTPDIPLNHGLVAIIGARGSGKTALADVIAAGCDAISPSGWNADENISPSFLARARKLIGNASTTLTWGGGATVTRALDGSDANGHMTFPRARYLSSNSSRSFARPRASPTAWLTRLSA